MYIISHALPNEFHACPDAKVAALALQRALAAIGAPMDTDLADIFKKYCLRRLEQRLLRYADQEFFLRLLIRDEGFRFGNKMSELLGLIRIVSGEDLDRGLQRDIEDVEAFRATVNRGLLAIHPGSSVLNAQRIMERFDGKGVQIAVFDVFDPILLEKQKRHYFRALIHNVVKFGNPVSLDHGNSVIDAMLSIAPAAEIIPVSSDSRASNDAIQFLLGKKEVLIVNMSRPLVQNAEGLLDPQFSQAFRDLLRQKIVVKALGNSGTDLEGNVSKARLEVGLGATGDLSAYDGALIKQLLNDLIDDHLILAQSWKIDGSEISLSATVVGENNAAKRRTLGAPADGIYSFVTGNFESGSSFAAPQISAVVALLLQAQLYRCGSIDIAKLNGVSRSDGALLDADASFESILGGC